MKPESLYANDEKDRNFFFFFHSCQSMQLLHYANAAHEIRIKYVFIEIKILTIMPAE